MSNRSTHLAHPPHAKEEAPTPDHSGGALTLSQVHPYEGETVVVTSDAVGVDGRLDPACTQDGDDASPPLAWSDVPDAQAWAVVVEDPDAPAADPVLHWAIWDIEAGLGGLPAAVEKIGRPESPQNAVQGRNTHGGFGYMGPKPPPGHGPHRYHFQVFALGKALGMGPDTTLVELVSALKGAAIASGELVATFETPDPKDLDSPGRTGAYGDAPA